jgi:sigma-B regulation protein RsbU (phosphoserine phosphatase)
VTNTPAGWTIVALRSLAGSLLIVALHLAFAAAFPASASSVKISLMLTILAILVVAIRWGRIPSAVASVCAAASYAFFFVPPTYSLRMDDIDEYFVGATLLIVALVASQLSLTAQRRAAEALASRIETERLYDFGRALLGPDSSTALAGTVVDELVRTFAATASAFRFDEEGLTHRAGSAADFIEMEHLAHGGEHAAGVTVIPVMSAETRMGIIATLQAAMSPLVQRSVATITSVALERVRGRELILRLARDIQMGFLPRSLPPFRNDDKVDLFAFIKPTYDVGGDFYSFSALDDERLFFAIGDVADKGIPAALFMARALTAIDISIVASPSLTDAISAVNRTLCSNNNSQMFATALAAVLDTSTGVVEYVDAGHEPPVIISADGRARVVEKHSGLALGFMPGYAYAAGRIELEPGDALVFYTDGFSEAMNSERELFGLERMVAALANSQRDTVEHLGHGLLGAVHRFVGDAPQSDDLTLLVVRYVPSLAQIGSAVVTVMEAVPS